MRFLASVRGEEGDIASNLSAMKHFHVRNATRFGKLLPPPASPAFFPERMLIKDKPVSRNQFVPNLLNLLNGYVLRFALLWRDAGVWIKENYLRRAIHFGKCLANVFEVFTPLRVDERLFDYLNLQIGLLAQGLDVMQFPEMLPH